MKIAIHQPQYFPWPRYVHKAIAADIFVYLDTVQFSKNGLQNRNQIKTVNGASWLTVPVKHEFGNSIRETQIADKRATTKHWKTLQANYSQAVGFQCWSDELRKLLDGEITSLAELAIASTEWMLEKLNVQTKRVRASELAGIDGNASKLVASICKTLDADTYLTGTGALDYLFKGDFDAIDCEIRVQQWQPFSYRQQWEKIGFVADLSTLDLLLNCPDEASEMLNTAGSWKALA
ncbi:MAG TPA: WbqC family protein [Pyrinomonadaceae bacterium]|nr:WbqC family protein [Pyrinomonadaceae bacterium]